MEQLRTIVGVLWRERFWVLTTIGIIFAVTCWYLSASSLDEQFSTRKKAIDGTFTSVQSLAREADHPNDQVISGNKAQARIERDQVLKTWEELYDKQKKEVLKWPADSLDADFIDTISELKFRDPFPPGRMKDMQDEYANFIGSRLDALLKIVDARKIEGTNSGRGGERASGRRSFSLSYETGIEGAGARDGEVEEEPDYIVEWLDQGNLRAKLTFDKQKPTPLQIWVTQEDLWVYETLLEVIHKTNEAHHATRPDNAAVRVISRLEVGREAAFASKEGPQIVMPEASTGTEGMPSEMGEGGGFDRTGGRSREFGEGEGEVDDSMVLAGRYLNAEGEPYPDAPEDPEFRRLPIHMELTMDQRWLPPLLVECANAALPVEVTRVNINPEKVPQGTTGGSGRRGAGRYEGGPARTQSSTPTDNPSLAEVVIDGIVYIYNEPNKDVLSVPGLEETGEEGDQFADADSNL